MAELRGLVVQHDKDNGLGLWHCKVTALGREWSFGRWRKLPSAALQLPARVASPLRLRCWRGSRRHARAQDVVRGGGGSEPTQPVRLRR